MDNPTLVTNSAATAIEGISEPTIDRYFEAMNAEEYETAAALFAPEGVMHPPFDSPLVGSEAIAHYLNAEAKGMRLEPRQGIAELSETGETQIKVTGKVQTPLFGVNVAWFFVLDEESAILSTRIKLLASLEDLLHLQK